MNEPPTPRHASGRGSFCHTNLRPSPQARPLDYDARIRRSRFLEVDPVEGGCSNDYGYVTDPVNETDLAGTACPKWSRRLASAFGARSLISAANLARQGRLSQAGRTALGYGPSAAAGGAAKGMRWWANPFPRALHAASTTATKVVGGVGRVLGRLVSAPVTAFATGFDYGCDWGRALGRGGRGSTGGGGGGGGGRIGAN